VGLEVGAPNVEGDCGGLEVRLLLDLGLNVDEGEFFFVKGVDGLFEFEVEFFQFEVEIGFKVFDFGDVCVC